MRLVDADALLQRAVPHGWSTPKWVSDIMIEDAPTIEVVRCGECVHNLRPDKPNSICEFEIPIFDIYGYCSEGKRREEEHNGE